MSKGSESVDVLEAQMTAVSDVQSNLAGLIEKSARIQSELSSSGRFSGLSHAIGEPFAAMSTAAEKLQDLFREMEIEKNRIRTEG